MVFSSAGNLSKARTRKRRLCVRKVSAGTILPNYDITIKDDDDSEDDDKTNPDNYRTYVIAADYPTAFVN